MTDDLTPADDETPEHLLRSIVSLSCRWTSAGIKGKGIRLADHELDLLNAVGLGDILMSAAAAEQKNQAKERRRLRSRAAPAAAPEIEEPDAVTEPSTVANRDVHSVATLAEYWAVGTDTVYALVNSGALPHFKLGGKLIRIRREAVELYELEAQV